MDTEGPGSSIDPFEAEAQLREMLRGRRMVFELGFDEATYRHWRKPLFVAMRRQRIADLRHQVPALFVTYMAYSGTFLYEGGDYWSVIHPSLKDDQAATGEYFVTATEKLGLESFGAIVAEERALRWVSRILAQGGIPRSCLQPFAELVWRDVSAGVADGAELISLWRTRQTALASLHKPTGRLLLYGGAEATDLVGRCVEWLRGQAGEGRAEAESVGLPGYVIDALAAAVAKTPRRSQRGMGDGIPVPRLRLDPYDGLGPAVMLPAVAPDQLGGAWRVQSGGVIHRQESTTYSTEIVKVSPASAAEVSFLTSDGLRREWGFEVLAGGAALLFDPGTQELVRTTGVLAAEEVWVLAPASSKITARQAGREVAIREIQRLPAPTGAWSGWRVSHLDLTNVDSLDLGDDTASRKLQVMPPRSRPELEGTALDGVFAEGDTPTYSTVPKLRLPGDTNLAHWHVRIQGPGVATSAPLATDESGLVDLAELLPANTFGLYRIRVRGPIGSDLVQRFAIVPDIQIVRPDKIVMPGGPEPTVTIEAPEVSVDGGPDGQAQIVSLPAASATFVSARLRHDSGRALDISVSVPRLLWNVVHDTKPALRADSHVTAVDASEFDDHLADTLLVKVGRPAIRLAVQLCDREGEYVQQLEPVTTVGAAGSWAFDLAPFADTIRQAGGARMSIYGEIGVRRVRMVDIASPADVRSLWARCVGDKLLVSFEEGRTVADRVLRLWSLSQPWRGPIEVPIPDGKVEVVSALGEELTFGRYYAQVSVKDPWVTPSRPSAQKPGLFPVTIGSKEQTRDALRELDPGDPLTLITWALARYHGTTEFDTDRLLSCTEEIAVALHALIDDTPHGQRGSREFDAVASIASANGDLFSAVLSSAAELDDAYAWLDRLSLRFVGMDLPSCRGVDDARMSAIWQACPALAARLDLACPTDEQVSDRLGRFLGWAPGDGSPATGGARVNQLALQLPAEQLRDLRFSLGLSPVGLLDPASRQLATFEWLLVNQETRQGSGGEVGEPGAWYHKFGWLLDEPVAGMAPGLRSAIDDHWDERMPPPGTEARAGVAALLWAAAVAYRFKADTRALEALEAALPWAQQLIRGDQVLLAVLERMHGTHADD